MDTYGNAVDTGYTGHDKYAAKVSWYGWLDCDRGDGPGGWCSNVCPSVSKSGEAGVGEYPDTSTDDCCGDDSGESLITETGGGDTPSGYNDGVQICCTDSTDCNYNGVCTSHGSVSARLSQTKPIVGPGRGMEVIGTREFVMLFWGQDIGALGVKLREPPAAEMIAEKTPLLL
jgi:hypothetical protein